MGDVNRGLYQKFSRIERADGRHMPGKRHHGCRYFVLDLTHDVFASVALRAYADVCSETYPALAADLRAEADAIGLRAATEGGDG